MSENQVPAAPRPSQATVHSFDPTTGDGSVISDHGRVMPFTADAWSSGPLRTLRLGQRVRVKATGDTVTSLTLATFPET